MNLPTTPTTPALQRFGTLCRWLVLAALTAQLVFAHGCHGDEDHELFGAIARVLDCGR